ncbi:hypothetical protein ABET52_02820 [Saccharococcus caldoxylosilyticus]|jgi:hypothetical protein|uniref:Uncharacterized protein n=1 Tax=Saccharococcus caldoxylosilyticus TaxID=81408 RepID=A0A150L660_9BACL|nr:hypothetical protein [Parageobacillus caldoxylosilyticus]KYD07476.1 hypothetical protein B4119_1366 [Parageobacillus caldoxylosilyticus]BDG35246.1 hypothetical protein PcaKH15_11520 [Parageobacillus caldoxylosilyticus]BDG39022.1 hypothetical protein PcaKH16_11610 [Parageobacillus caldoxylosilyticus]BDG42811.1 hypothetical protein PcaKH35_11560 [Parageobacillus caldoxylosilyticus]
MEYLGRYQGETVEVIDRNGWVHRGVIDGSIQYGEECFFAPALEEDLFHFS